MATPQNVEDVYPLTPAQMGMLYQSLASGDPSTYYEQVRCDLVGPLDIARLQRAWQTVSDRHPMLRSVFLWDGLDKPVQAVRRTVEIEVDVVDWRVDARPAADEPADLDALAAEHRARGCDLTHAPVSTLTVVVLSASRSHFIWDFHHILLDGWSAFRVFDEAMKAYAAPEVSAVSAPPFRNYVAWHQQQDQDAARTYWTERLAGFGEPNALPLPTGRSTDDRTVARTELQIDADVSATVAELARLHRVTVNTVVQAAWAVVMSRCSRTDDVVFGVTSSGRPAELDGVEDIVGMFLSTLPLRLDVPTDMTVADWLPIVQRFGLDLTDYQYTSLADVGQWSDVPAGTDLFDTILVFENFPRPEPRPDEEVQVENYAVFEKTGYGLTLLVVPGDQMKLIGLHDPTRFADDSVAELLERLVLVLTQMATEPDAPVGELDIVTPSEWAQLETWNDTATPPSDDTALTLFAQQATANPGQAALLAGDHSLTFAELDQRANRLAHRLIADGVGPETPVGVAIPRSFDMVVAALAVLKAGGAYVPMDPSYPPTRLALMAEGADLRVVITQYEMDAPWATNAIDLSTFDDTPWPTTAPPVTVGPDNSMMLAFTSGSTGRPKAVQVHHRGVVNRCRWGWETYPVETGEVFAQKTTFSFADHAWELWGGLLSGTPVLLVADEAVRDAEAFVAHLSAHPVRRIVLVPSLLRALLDAMPDLGFRLPNLRYWTVSGEATSAALAARFREAVPHAVLINVYGMSEASADATWFDDRWESDAASLPIGRPLTNANVFILDHHDRVQPPGLPGEIHVGGTPLSRGYWGRDDLTAERFPTVAVGSDTPRRVYRTGDIGRWGTDGIIDYLGRVDDQVKIRGHRVELGEVEAAVHALDSIADAIVVARSFGEDQRLIAYVIGTAPVDDAVVRSELAARLPDFMVPAYVQHVDAWPLTPSGKLDRSRLPDPPTGSGAADATPAEREMIAVWEEALVVEGIGPDDDFFALGGHSLLALRLASRISRDHEVNLPLAAFLATPTPRALTRVVAELQASADDGGGAVAAPDWEFLVPITAGHDGRMPIFCVHGAGGNVVNFHGLAQRLGQDRCFVAVQARGVDGARLPHASIDEMVGDYLEELRRYRPTGPYLLAGFSGGGLIAHEMARQLRLAGDAVAGVILLDTFHPSSVATEAMAKRGVREVLRQGPGYLVSRVERRRNLGDRARQIEAAVTALREHNTPIPFDLRDMHVTDNTRSLLRNFETGPLDAPLVLAVAAEQPDYVAHVPEHRGWEARSTELHLVRVPGNHDTLVLDPHVDVLAERLAPFIDRLAGDA